MSEWNWLSSRQSGARRDLPSWWRAFAFAVPWITVGLLLLMIAMISNTLSLARGTVFELPDAGAAEVEASSLVALMMPGDDARTLVFFDDARYSLDESVAAAALGDHLADRSQRTAGMSLLVLADRRIPGGDLMKFAAIARRSGIGRLLFAEKRSGERTE